MTAPDAAAAPRLERPRESAFRGVCSSLARSTGTDAVLWRVLLVVLVFFDGLGVLLYLLGMLFIPYEGEQQSLFQRLAHGPDRRLSREQQVLVVILAIVGIGWVGHPRSAVVLGVAGVLGYLVWRNRSSSSPVITPVATVTADAPLVSDTVAFDPPAVPWEPPPPKPRSPLGGITFAVAAIVAGVLALIGVSGVDMPVAVPIAGALAVVGVGLVAGSFFGRSWGLFLLAGLLAASLGVATGVQPLIDDGVGKRDWNPTGASSYTLGAGKGVLDLSGITEGSVTAHVGYGQLLVEIPQGQKVDIDAHSDYGDIEYFGTSTGGRHQVKNFGAPDAPLHLDLSVRAGEIKVVQL